MKRELHCTTHGKISPQMLLEHLFFTSNFRPWLSPPPRSLYGFLLVCMISLYQSSSNFLLPLRSFPSHPLQKPPLHFDGKIICSLAWILPVFFSNIHPRQHLGLLTYKNVNIITNLRMGDQGSLSYSSHSISTNLLR